jgi:hypothetical protein
MTDLEIIAESLREFAERYNGHQAQLGRLQAITITGDLPDARCRGEAQNKSMKPFTQLSEIEQFTEDPRNHVCGEFRCLLTDVRVYGCYSADRVLWRMAHKPDAGRHPYATERAL